jgi:hypothetical protein
MKKQTPPDTTRVGKNLRKLTRFDAYRNRYDEHLLRLLCRGSTFVYTAHDKRNKGMATLSLAPDVVLMIPCRRTRVGIWVKWLWATRQPHRLYTMDDLVRMFSSERKSYQTRMGRALKSVGFVLVAQRPNIYWVPKEKDDAIPKHLRSRADVEREYERQHVKDSERALRNAEKLELKLTGQLATAKAKLQALRQRL